LTVFKNYARYYDLLYRDKDYSGEVAYIQSLIKKSAPDSVSILELGCGTGRHAVLLAEEGFILHGVDFSEAMLTEAEERRSVLPPAVSQRLEFSLGDVRNVRVEGAFDVVVSLFHVVSYQTTNDDLQAVFATAKAHLKPGGLFMFDCWYGPAVLTDRPAVRVKELEDEHIHVTRTAIPELYSNENRVDVNYQLAIRDKATGEIEEVRETHHMRYLFTPEVAKLFDDNDMEMVFSCEWMTEREPDFDTWGVCFGGRLKHAR
jgi:SAM-dependent methyltransferase